MEDRFRFRAWNKQDKTMIYNAEDVYDGSLSGWCGNKNNNNDGWISCFGEYLGREEYVVMQSTGLKDRNGKLIFEGDIVRAESYPFYRKEDRKYNYYAEICWDEESASFFYYTFCISKDVQGISTGNTGEISEYKWEVIGNIYENKELLKEQKIKEAQGE